jgi:NADPH2:quinone reductase
LKPPLPFLPGAEMAGVVTAVGRVYALQAGRSRLRRRAARRVRREKSRRPTRSAIAMPAGAPLDVAASFILAYGTSHHALTDRAA